MRCREHCSNLRKDLTVTKWRGRLYPGYDRHLEMILHEKGDQLNKTFTSVVYECSLCFGV